MKKNTSNTDKRITNEKKKKKMVEESKKGVFRAQYNSPGDE